jgi:hypothetical protein
LMERRSRFGFTFPVMLAIQCYADWTFHGSNLSCQLYPALSTDQVVSGNAPFVSNRLQSVG